jgi:hypothetical protein
MGLSQKPERSAADTWLRATTAGAIHRRVNRLNYSWRCVEASAIKAHMNLGLPLAPGMKIGYVVKDAKKWEVDPGSTASEFDVGYYRGLLEKAWGEVAFVFASETPTMPSCSWGRSLEMVGPKALNSLSFAHERYGGDFLVTIVQFTAKRIVHWCGNRMDRRSSL